MFLCHTNKRLYILLGFSCVHVCPRTHTVLVKKKKVKSSLNSLLARVLNEKYKARANVLNLGDFSVRNTKYCGMGFSPVCSGLHCTLGPLPEKCLVIVMLWKVSFLCISESQRKHLVEKFPIISI